MRIHGRAKKWWLFALAILVAAMLACSSETKTNDDDSTTDTVEVCAGSLFIPTLGMIGVISWRKKWL